MKAFTIIPKRVKVLKVFYDWHWDRYIREIKGHRWIIGKYYIAEHSKTYPLKKGDCFIIKEIYDKNSR